MCMLTSPSPAWQESDFMKQHGQRMREIQRERKNTGMQICLRVLGRHVDCFNLLTAELY